MCDKTINPKKKWYRSPFFFLAMIILGGITGYFNLPLLKPLGLILSDIFIKLFECISLPLISLSILVTLTNIHTNQRMRTICQRALRYTFGTTFIAACVSLLLYLLIHPASIEYTHVGLTAPETKTSYLHQIANIIPSSLFAPFIEHQVMAVLFLSVIIGIGIRYIPDNEAQQTLTQFIKGAHGLFMVMTRWIIAIIPLGLFGFITTTFDHLQQGLAIKGFGEYLLVIVLANLIQGVIILPIWLKYNGIKPFSTFKSMLPALSLAFFSKSSVGTLPVTMETAEKNLNIKPDVSRFIFPLCTSLNMNGCAAFIFTTVIYLLQNQGTILSLPMMMLWVLIATIAAIGNAGIPMGCFFLSASLLASMGVPITLLGLILPFYSLIDMLETALNVWSDSCVVKVLDNQLHPVSNVEYLEKNS